MEPDEILTKKVLSMPHRTYVRPYEREEDQIRELRHALKEMVRKELLEAK